MSIRYSYPIYLSALLLLLAACTQDELTDDTRLPEGQYPLQIAAVTLSVEGGEAQPWGAPQTRVGETGDGTGSTFSAGDKFAVQIDGKDETGIYIVQDNNTIKADAPLYWTNTIPNRTVSAWYPATDGTLDLGDQSQSLAYLLSGTGTGDYRTSVELTFTHQLAKVRVTPTGEALGEVQSLQLYTYTQCTYEKGTVVQGSQEGWIEMKQCEYTENGNAITCWEANVVPGYTITKLQANGNEVRDLSAAINPVAGKFYNITLNYDPGYTIEDDGSYTVYTANGLLAWNEAVQSDLSLNCTLTADITLTGEWTPIGTDYRNSYTGTFDGDNHTISGLIVTGSDEYAGLFGYIGSGGTVKDVTLEGVQIATTHSVGDAGGVAGNNDGAIENCSVSGSVSGSFSVGGVVGHQWGGTITGCSSSATVNAGIAAGGIAGETNGGASLTACYATGDVTVENDGTSYACAGGIVGMNGGNSTLTACYAAGNVSGKGSGTIYVGGAVGENYGTLTACYWSGLPDNDNGGATKVDGNWTDAMKAMNTALSGTSWQYVLGSNNLPVLEKNQ